MECASSGRNREKGDQKCQHKKTETGRTRSAVLLSLALGAALAALVALATVGVGPAEAAFPGANGKIAFVSVRDDNAEIYSMNPDGFNQTNLTKNLASDRLPAFSPDGTKIAFTSSRDGNIEIYVMSAKDGSKQKNRTNNEASVSFPDWGWRRPEQRERIFHVTA
jgi:hypothetical protein